MSPEHGGVDAWGVASRLRATLFFVVLNGFFVGRLARQGDVVTMGPYRVEVAEASPRRVERLRIVPLSDSRDSPDSTACEPNGEGVVPLRGR